MSKLELRVDNTEIEVRAAEKEGEMPTIEGYAVVWGARSKPIMGMFYEQFERGAFKEWLGTTDEKEPAVVTACINHRSDAIPLARWKNGKGTLSLKEDSKGLRYSFQPANTQDGRDVVESIKRGDMDGMSFAFRAIDDEAKGRVEGLPLRTVKKASIHDITITQEPYYEATSVALRSATLGAMTEEEYRAAYINKEESDPTVEAAARARKLRLLDLTASKISQ